MLNSTVAPLSHQRVARVEALAYGLVKYRRRDGWSHRDLLRLAHPQTAEPARRALFDWVCRGTEDPALPGLVHAVAALARCGDASEVAALIRAHDLPREAVPTEWLELSNLVGPASYVKERVEAFREAGVTHLNATPVGDNPAAIMSQLKDWIS